MANKCSRKFFQDLTNTIEKVFDFRYDEHGNAYVVELGERDIQEEIDSYEDEVGIYNIIAKFNLTGNAGLFNQGDPKYMDTAGMPDNLNDQNELAQQAGESLRKLDPELKGEARTIEEFLSSISEEKLKAYIDAKVAAATEKKKEAE